MKYFFTVFFSVFCLNIFAQQKSVPPYWNNKTQLLPWRFSPQITNITYEDLDNDGDPDILRGMLNDSIPIMWIDDDDDMKYGDKEGDTHSDCLLIDVNRDGIFAGPNDFSVDWSDIDGDGKADVMLVVSNAGLKGRNFYDWGADFMYFLDNDKDGIMHYIDWNKILTQAWEHNGHAGFFTDYSGNSTFLKMHASSFRIDDLRYNWENPFIFYDEDNDKLTEWAIRLVDTPHFRGTSAIKNKTTGLDKVNPNYDVKFKKKIDYAAITWDLDNDNAPQNEFDFDMGLLFKGKGFDYQNQAHYFKNMKGLSAANKYLYDFRWRNIDTLFYPDRNTAYDLTFNRGDWQETRLVFDEDDDCNRWERVEFYDPKDIFKIGVENGGLDHNKQADALGDRGEFDMDNSGKGQLYIGAFDGRIHLYGAEWGAWRIDQTAFSYQGFGGQYDRWGKDRLQKQQGVFATVKYTDTDNNGFIDFIQYDLDGDKIFEDSVSLKKLGIDDKVALINTGKTDYKGFNQLFTKVADAIWDKAMQAVDIAKKNGIETSWYNFYMQPHSIQEKYSFGYWLGFYLYQDIRYATKLNNDVKQVNKIDKAYYSGDWSILSKQN